jgi:signal transduction histidine kinase
MDLNPSAVAHFNNLSALLRDWNESPHDGSGESSTKGLRIIAAADGLDSVLTTVTEARQRQVRGLERVNVISAAVLAPVALIAMLIVTWSGRRVLAFARVAEEERREVVRAANARAALLRGVTHDVKNPLGAAAGYAQLLEEGVVGPLTPPQDDMVRRIHRLVHTAVQTVTDLLELARSDGELHMEYATTDLSTVVTEAVEDHRGMAQEHGVAIHVAAPIAPVVTDPVRVRQILANLLSNAIKYTPPGGRIEIRIRRDGPALHWSIRDSGIGISQESQARLFEKFFRADNAHTIDTEGTGLGLYLVRLIVERLGGTITCESEVGRGTLFHFTLPITAGDTK